MNLFLSNEGEVYWVSSSIENSCLFSLDKFKCLGSITWSGLSIGRPILGYKEISSEYLELEWKKLSINSLLDRNEFS